MRYIFAGATAFSLLALAALWQGSGGPSASSSDSNVATAVAAGGDHTCALTDGGVVKCWGDNDGGQLGAGGLLGLGSGITHVSAGSEGTCAVTSAGAAKCWGQNRFGQLGDGTTTDRATPVNVVGLGTGVTSIETFAFTTCALRTTGGVSCWGRNDHGQLGDGTTTGSAVPVDVLGLSSDVSSISVGGGHACALTTQGAVKCWGFNDIGQVGDGSTVDQMMPANVNGLGSGVISIAAGGQHTCAVMASGGVKCWGQNSHGQLGNGVTSGLDANPEPVGVLGLTSGVAAIDLGGRHTCAITTVGGAKCWGDNESGQLGDGTTTSRSAPVDVVGLDTGVAALQAGGLHTCAVTTAGGAMCWGLNNAGQLGDGTTIDRATPVDVLGFAPTPSRPILHGERGTAVLTEAIRTGRDKAVSGLVIFAEPQPDTNYTAVFVSTDTQCRGQMITDKTTSGFRAVCGGNFANVTIDWVVIR